jgi:hypothetical protein
LAFSSSFSREISSLRALTSSSSSSSLRIGYFLIGELALKLTCEDFSGLIDSRKGDYSLNGDDYRIGDECLIGESKLLALLPPYAE